MSRSAAHRLVVCGMVILGLSLSPAGAAPPGSGGLLRVATVGEPPTLDVHANSSTLTRSATIMVYETLFTFDKNYAVIPQLVDTYRFENGGRTLAMTLRKGVLFQNGDELTSADVVASLTHWGRLAAIGKTLWDQVTELAAVDRYTVRLTLKEPVAVLLFALATPQNGAAIYPKSVLDKAGGGPVQDFIGTGPYRIAEHVPDRVLRLVRFDRYAARSEPADGLGGKRQALLNEVDYLPTPEASTRLAGVEAGQYDVAFELHSDDLGRVRSNPDLAPLVFRPGCWSTAIFNKKKGVFTDPRMRTAFNWALDKRLIMLGAFGDPALWRLDPGLMPNETFWHSTIGQDVYNANDPAKARQLLKEAGYEGQPLVWLTTQTYDYMFKSAVIAQQQLRAVGLNTTLRVMDWASLAQARTSPDTFDVLSGCFDFQPDPYFGNVWLNASWYGWWDSAKKDRVLQRLVTEVDVRKRKAAWDDLQRLVYYEEMPVVKFGDAFALGAIRENVKGYVTRPYSVFWNVWLQK